MSAEKNVEKLLGNPRKAITSMAIPLIISLLVSQVNVLADRAWCSGLGVDALASVAVVVPIYCTVCGLGSGLGVGASAVVSRLIGAGKTDDASVAGVQAIAFAVVFSLVLTPIMVFFQRDLLIVLGGQEVIDTAVAYLGVYSACTLILVMNGTVSGVLNGQGATNLSTVMMAVLAVSNMILDPVFIYSFGMGIQGASVATVISTVLSLVIGLRFLKSRRTFLDFDRGSFRFHATHMRAVLVAGIPQMIEYAIMYAMNAVLNMVVLYYAGSEGLTIYSTPDNLIDFIVIPAMAIGSAVVPVVSSAYGQGNKERMRKSFLFAVKLGILCVIGLALLTELFANEALFIFTYSGEMQALKPYMVNALRIMCLYSWFFAFTPLCSGYLQALGHPNRSVIIALWRNIVLITFFYVFGAYGLEYIFWALVCGHIVGAVTIIAVALLTERKVFRKMGQSVSSEQHSE